MSAWEFRGRSRPSFAIRPGPGQESVWDYPRPPCLERDTRRITVWHGKRKLADSTRAYRVLETASPPTFYLPPEDVVETLLTAVAGGTMCEWKGVARYWALAADGDAGPVAWTYPDPPEGFRAIAGYYAFYPGSLACFVNAERVRPQPGRYYGGWVTSELVGPFKGEPGTGHW
ncbi:DUF427 domain-containing protein [Ectothiorhodospiraceae bacterium WFHF3C12]|nr:DUF427 domain-containing protein [Ectothiorhodospiraceae bacterium WFHF3C12]